MSVIIKEYKTIFEECQLLYNLLYGFLSKVTPEIKAKSMTTADLTDFGFLCRELENLFDELRKEVKARKELCGSIIAYRLIQESLNDPTITMKSKGTLATGTPDVKMRAALPKKFTAEYFELTDHFGVPRDVAEAGILRLDWNRVTEFCTELTAAGKPIPKGFGKQYPLYTTVFRKTKGGQTDEKDDLSLDRHKGMESQFRKNYGAEAFAEQVEAEMDTVKYYQEDCGVEMFAELVEAEMGTD